MKVAIFYEKTGCSGNKRQKELLQSYGVFLDVRSILDKEWSKKELESFFDGLAKEDIVNKFAPQIKSGEVKVSEYSKDELIDMMLKTPILIKRPLIQIGESKVCGFDIEKLNKLLDIEIDTNKDISNCTSSDKCNSV
jgi:nitrogenase-associated protein